MSESKTYQVDPPIADVIYKLQVQIAQLTTELKAREAKLDFSRRVARTVAELYTSELQRSAKAEALLRAKDATITALREGLAKALSFVPDIDNCQSDPSPGELAELSALLSSTLPRETEGLADPEAGKRDAVTGAASTCVHGVTSGWCSVCFDATGAPKPAAHPSSTEPPSKVVDQSQK